jgi:cbb3-type cytochrome oxidase maturation protein
MSVLFLVVPLAILIAGTAVIAFAWAAKHGQFDDLDTPALRVATEDDDTAPPRDLPAAPSDQPPTSTRII